MATKMFYFMAQTHIRYVNNYGRSGSFFIVADKLLSQLNTANASVLFNSNRLHTVISTGMFAIASVTSLIGVLEPVINRIPIGTTKIPRRLLPCFYGSLQIRHVFLIVFAIALTAAWLLLRHKPWSWALQDLLGKYQQNCFRQLLR